MKKRISAILLAALMVASLIPMSGLAAGGYVTVNGGTTEYATMNDAITAAAAVSGEITYTVYGAVELNATAKTSPDMAKGAAVVNIVGGNENAKLTLTGIYCGRIVAAGAELNISEITLADGRKASGEGRDPDPWEFCYLEYSCGSLNCEKVNFVEGTMVGVDATFTDCHFTVEPQYYTESNGTTFDPATNYGEDHYGLWIAEHGDVVVTDCVFEDVPAGGIKSTWEMYSSTPSDLTLTVTGTTFINCSYNDTHKPIHLDGAAEINLSGNGIVGGYDSGETDPNAALLNNKLSGVTTKSENNIFGSVIAPAPAYAGPVMNWVKVNAADNGVVKSGPLAASAGATVTLYPKAAEGYVLDTVEVLDAEGNAVVLDGLKFAIPAGGVTVNATFKLAD